MLVPVLFSLTLITAPQPEPAPEPITVVVPQVPTAAPSAEKGDAKRFLRVAVYDLSTDGVEPRVGRFVTDAFVAELRKLEGISVVAMDEVRAMLDHEANKDMIGCSEGASCMSEIGDALGVEWCVVGSLATVGDNSVMTVRRIDQAAARAVGSLSEKLVPAGGEEFLALVGPSIEQLFSDRPVKAGAVRGVPQETARRLNPPPLSPWVMGGTAASGLVLIAAGAGAGIASLQAQSTYRALVDQANDGTPIDSKLLREQEASANFAAITANVLYGVGAVVGIVSLLLIPMTNFESPPPESL